MALTTSDNPKEDKPAAKSEEQKAVVQEVEEKRQADVAKVDQKDADILSAAAASGDASVHNLLGERAIAELNGDTAELKRIDGKLAEIVK
jgi:hypothetical protein